MNNNCKKVLASITEDIPTNIARLDNLYYNRDKYNTDLYLQRGLVWTLKQQSTFIQSLLRNIKPPSIIINNKDNIFNVIDGCNRLLTIFRFFSNEFALDKNTKAISIINMSTGENEIYDIANKMFKDFPLELQNHFSTRTLNVDIYNNLDEDMQTELLFLLNNGTAMKSIHKARIQNYKSDIQELVKELKSTELMTRKLNMSDCYKNQKLDEQLLYNLIAEVCNVPLSLGRKNYQKLSAYIIDNNLLTEEVKNEIISNINNMNDILPCKKKWFNKNNFNIIYRVCYNNVKEYNNISGQKLFMLIDGFFNSKHDYTGYNNTKSEDKKYSILDEYIKSNLK